MFEELSEPKLPNYWYKERWFIITVLAVVVWFGLPMLLQLFITRPVEPKAGFTVASGVSSATAPAVVNVTTVDDPASGLVDAPVTIVEFGDFECPFSKEVYPILKQVINKYPDAVRFIYRDFPVADINPQALPAAEAANCAGVQGKFWQFHDQLFTGQDKLGTAFYDVVGASLGLNTESFKRCRENHQTLLEIEDDFKAGVAAGVRGTPTFFVNGRKVEGALPLAIWDKIIASELQRKFRSNPKSE